MARRVHARLLAAEAPAVDDYLAQRLRGRGADAEVVKANLSRLPASLPQHHRWSVLQRILNAVPTARLYRFLHGGAPGHCFLCGAGEDSVEHMAECPIVVSVYDTVCMHAGIMDEWSPNHAFLNVQLDGAQLQTVAALMFAVGKIRRVLSEGRTFHDSVECRRHLCSLVEHPWMSASALTLSRRDRRARRAADTAPAAIAPDAILYRSDGAARGQGNGGGEVDCSCTAVQIRGGQVKGRVSSRFPTCSNSV